MVGFGIFLETELLGHGNGLCAWQEEVRAGGLKGDSQVFA